MVQLVGQKHYASTAVNTANVVQLVGKTSNAQHSMRTGRFASLPRMLGQHQNTAT
jgi:hypothetical protein